MQGFTTMTPAQALNGHCVKNFIEDFSSLPLPWGVVAKVGGLVIVKTKEESQGGRDSWVRIYCQMGSGDLVRARVRQGEA